MNALDSLLSTPLAYHLGWTLVHFLWQGLLVGALYACLRRSLRNSEPQTRYWLSLGTLSLLALLPIFTFIHLLGSPIAVPEISGIAGGIKPLAPVAQLSIVDQLRELLHPIVPWTVPAWCVGVALMGLRSYGGWRKTLRLTQIGAVDAPVEWQDSLVELATRVGVRVRVQLMITATVAVPCVVGWLKPVILIPPAALTGLSTMQLEMVLAHELSHIRRHDYLVNLLQLLVETLLFYHPVVRWISQDVRRERELCCDDSAVHACGDALHYAHALTDLADIQAADMRLALGLNGGDLTLRVERLIAPHHVSEGAPRFTTLMLASALFLGSLMMMASARHIPLPLTQSRFVPFHQHLQVSRADTQGQVERMPTLPPTEVRVAAWQGLAETRLQPTGYAPASTLATLSDPTPPLQATDPVHAMIPVAAAQSTALQVVFVTQQAQADQDGDLGKSATAPMRIIPVNNLSDTQQTQAGHHQYCTPLTGSRVCR